MEAPSTAERRVTVSPARLRRWLDGFEQRHGTLTTVRGDPSTLEVLATDGATAGIGLPWGPVPAADDVLDAVVAYHLQDRLVGVLLARRKAHAVGLFHGDQLIARAKDHHYVQGRTKAGGWSQQRYARRRANQASKAAAEAADDVVTVLDGQALEALITGGDKAMVAEVLSDPRLSALARLNAAGAHPCHPVPDPNATILTSFPATYRAVRITLNAIAVSHGGERPLSDGAGPQPPR